MKMNPKYSDWVRLPSGVWNRPVSTGSAGAEVISFASPYDVPIAIRVGVDDRLGVFIVDFSYPGGAEVLKKIEKPGPVRAIFLGASSRRIHGAEIDLEALESTVNQSSAAARLSEIIQPLLSDLAKEPEWPQRADNYRFAERAIEISEGLIGQQIAAAA